VVGRLAEGSVIVEIHDSGRWKPAANTDDSRGRGLQLIEDLVSEIEIRTESNGTTLRLVCRL
jgi:two-component sensor histidine kinase